jgi:hypothetical protein
VTSLAAARPPGTQRTRPALARMTWVTWRQHRAALAGTGLLLGAFALVFGVTGLRMQHALAAMVRAGCPVTGGPTDIRCGALENAFYRAGHLAGITLELTVALSAIPFLVGMFAGAPLLAREYEAGTFRFAWTQAAGRTRWVTAKLGLLGVTLAAAAAAFGALVSWWLSMANDIGSGNRWQPAQFGLTPVTFAAWTLLAFALGAFLGALARRTVPAMAMTAVCAPVLFLAVYHRLDGWLTGIAPVVARESLLNLGAYAPGSPPVTFVAGTVAITSVPAGSWPLRSWITGPGGQAPAAALVNRMQSLPTTSAENRFAAAHHLALWTAYEPAGRFWGFQAIEGAMGLLLALVLGAGTVWLVRRRAA